MKPTSLRKTLDQLLRNSEALDPLPPTRELGQRDAVANTTVYRELRRLVEEGRLWQHPNGRFYPAAARPQLDRPQPVACLFRRLELCSTLYRELLEGISQGCGQAQRGMLLWHDDGLVNHPDPAEPPIFADDARQRKILADYLERHGKAAGGYLLDHVWSDAVLTEFSDRLAPGALLFRRGNVPGIDNVRANFASAALLAFGHLLGRGFERIVPVQPFAHDPAVDEFLDELVRASHSLGCPERLAARTLAATAKQCSELIERLRAEGGRIALVCPEDHVSRFLQQAIDEAGLRCPAEIGLLSAMGTSVAGDAKISRLAFDFRTMGQRAVERLARPTSDECKIDAQLIPGNTT